MAPRRAKGAGLAREEVATTHLDASIFLDCLIACVIKRYEAERVRARVERAHAARAWAELAMRIHHGAIDLTS